MTRTEFVKAYAKRSNVSDAYAEFGEIVDGPRTIIALPCACGNPACEGWAMMGASAVHDHLFYDAPEKLRQAYCDAVEGNL